MGPSPLNRREIQAWERDEMVTLQPWERRTILRIDQAMLAARHTKDDPPTETHQPKEA